jgi:hypothetical protein
MIFSIFMTGDHEVDLNQEIEGLKERSFMKDLDYIIWGALGGAVSFAGCLIGGFGGAITGGAFGLGCSVAWGYETGKGLRGFRLRPILSSFACAALVNGAYYLGELQNSVSQVYPPVRVEEREFISVRQGRGKENLEHWEVFGSGDKRECVRLKNPGRLRQLEEELKFEALREQLDKLRAKNGR